MKKRRLSQEDKPEGLTHNPFASLRSKGSIEPRSEPAPIDPPAAEVSHTHIVVRREKRGRAGKTMTRVAGLSGESEALEDLAREMKRALGCGAALEDGDILLQGAMTERAAAWLEKRFKSDVTIGN